MYLNMIKCFSVEMFIRFLLVILISEKEWINTFASVKATLSKQDWENITKPEASSLFRNFTGPANADNFSARENDREGILTLLGSDKNSVISQTNQSGAQNEYKLSAVPNENSTLLVNSKPVFEKFNNSSTDFVKQSKYLEDSNNGLDSQMIELSSVVEAIQKETENYDKYSKSNEDKVSGIDSEVDIEPLVVIDVRDTNRNKSINGTHILYQRQSLTQLTFNDSKDDHFKEFENRGLRNRRNAQVKPEWISRKNLYRNNKNMFDYQNKQDKDALYQNERAQNMEQNTAPYQNSYANAYDDNEILDSEYEIPVKALKERSGLISKDKSTDFDDKTKVLENKNIAVNKQTYYINKDSLKQLNESINVNEKIIPYKSGTFNSNFNRNISDEFSNEPLAELQLLKMKLSNNSIKDKNNIPYERMNKSNANLEKYAERMHIKPAPTGFVEFLRPEKFETPTGKKKLSMYNRKRINNRVNKMVRVINATESQGSSKKRHLQNDKEKLFLNNRHTFDSNYISRNEDIPNSAQKQNDYFRQTQAKLKSNNLPQNKISVKKIYNPEGMEPGLQIDIPPAENLIDIMASDSPFNEYAGSANKDQAELPQFKDYQRITAGKIPMRHGDRLSENKSFAKEIRSINKVKETENIQIEKQIPLNMRETSTYGDRLMQNDPYNFRLVPLQRDLRNGDFNQAKFPNSEKRYQIQKKISQHRMEKSAYGDLLSENDPYNFRLVPMANDFRYNWYNQANIPNLPDQTQKQTAHNRGQIPAYGDMSIPKDPYRWNSQGQMANEYDFRNQINKYQTPDTYADLYYNYRNKRLPSDENNFLKVEKGSESKVTTSEYEQTETASAESRVTFDYTDVSFNEDTDEDIVNKTLPTPLRKIDKKSKNANPHKIEKQIPLNRKEKSSYDDLLMDNNPYNFGLYQLNNDFANDRYRQANFPKVQNPYEIDKQIPQKKEESSAHGNVLMQNDPYNFRWNPYEQIVNKYDFQQPINIYQTPDTYANLYYNYRNKRSDLDKENFSNIKNKKESSVITSANENFDVSDGYFTHDFSNVSYSDEDKRGISTDDYSATKTGQENTLDYGQGFNNEQQHSTDVDFYKTSTAQDSNLSTNKVRKLFSFTEDKVDLVAKKGNKKILNSTKIPKKVEKTHKLKKHMPLHRRKKSPYDNLLMSNDPYNFGLYSSNNYYRNDGYGQANFPKVQVPYQNEKQAPQYKTETSTYGNVLMRNDPYDFRLYPSKNYYRNYQYGQAPFPKGQVPYQYEKQASQYRTDTSTYGNVLMPNDPYNFRLVPYERRATTVDYQKAINLYQTPDTYADLYYNYRKKRLQSGQEEALNFKNGNDWTAITSATTIENIETEPSDNMDSNFSKNELEEISTFPDDKIDLNSKESTNNKSNDTTLAKITAKPQQLKKKGLLSKREESPYGNLLIENNPYNFGLYPSNNDFWDDSLRQSNYPKSQNIYQIDKQLPQYTEDRSGYGNVLMQNDPYNFRINPYEQMKSKYDFQKQINKYQTPDTYADLYYNYRNKRSDFGQEKILSFKNEGNSKTITSTDKYVETDRPDRHVTFDSLNLDVVDDDKNMISTNDDIVTETSLENALGYASDSNSEQYYNTDTDFYETLTEKDSNLRPNNVRKLLSFTKEKEDSDTKKRSKNIFKREKSSKKLEKQHKLKKNKRLNKRKKSPYGNMLMQNDPYNFGLYALNNYYKNDRYDQTNFAKAQNPYVNVKQVPQYRTETSRLPFNQYQTPDTYADLYYNYRKKRLPFRQRNNLNLKNGEDSTTKTYAYENIESDPSNSTNSNINKKKDQELLSFTEDKDDLNSIQTTKNIFNSKKISKKAKLSHLLKKPTSINRSEKSPYENLLMDNNPYNFGLYPSNNDFRNDRYSQAYYQNTYKSDKQVPQYGGENAAYNDILMSNDLYNYRLNPYEQKVTKFDFKKRINSYQTPDTYADLYYNYRNKRSDLGLENFFDMKNKTDSSIATLAYGDVKTDADGTFDYSNLSLNGNERDVISTSVHPTTETSSENTLEDEEGSNIQQNYNSDMDDFDAVNDSNFSKGKNRKLLSFEEENGNLFSKNRNKNELKDTKIYKRAENSPKKKTKEKHILLKRRKKSPYGDQLTQNDPYNFGLYPLNNYYRNDRYSQDNFPKAENPYQNQKQAPHYRIDTSTYSDVLIKNNPYSFRLNPYEQRLTKFDFQKPINSYQTPDTYADLYYNYRNKRLSLGQENSLNFKNAKDSTAYENIETHPSNANDSKLNKGKNQETEFLTEEKDDLDSTERTKDILNGKINSEKSAETLHQRETTPLNRREKSAYGDLLMENNPYNFGLYRINNDFTDDRYSQSNFPKVQNAYQIEKQIPQYRAESSAYGDVFMPNDPYNNLRYNPYEQRVTTFDFQKPLNRYQTPDTYADLYYNYRNKRSDIDQEKFSNIKNDKVPSINNPGYKTIETDDTVTYDYSNLSVADDERNVISTRGDFFATETLAENAVDNGQDLNNKRYNSGNDHSKNSTAKDSNLSVNKVRKLLSFTKEHDLAEKKKNKDLSKNAEVPRKPENSYMLKNHMAVNGKSRKRKSAYDNQLMQNDPYNFGLYSLNNYYKNNRYGQANFPKAQNPYQIEKQVPQYRIEASTYGDILMQNDPYNFRLIPYEQKVNKLDFQKPINRYQTPDTYADLYYNYRNKRLSLGQETSLNLKDRKDSTISNSANGNMEINPSDSNNSKISKNKYGGVHYFRDEKNDFDSVESTTNILNDNKTIKHSENPHQQKKPIPLIRKEKSSYGNNLMDNNPYNFGLYQSNKDFKNDWYNQANYPKAQNPYQIPQYRGESFAQGGNLMPSNAYNVRLYPYQQMVTKSEIQQPKNWYQTPDTYADLYYNSRNKRSPFEWKNFLNSNDGKFSSTTVANNENTQKNLPDAQVTDDYSNFDTADREKNIKDMHNKTQSQPSEETVKISDNDIEILSPIAMDIDKEVMNDFNRLKNFIRDDKKPKTNLLDKQYKIRDRNV